MSDRQKDEDDVEEKEDGKEEGDSEEGGGNSGIHKYFGKSNKSFKLVTNKIKKNFRLQNYQNVSLLLQTSASSQKQLSNAHQKTKLKCEYKWSSEFLNTKPKLKLTFNPFIQTKFLEQALLNWKTVYDKSNQQNVDIKLNDKKQLNLKYRRTKWDWDRRLRNKLEIDTAFEQNLNMKASVSLETMLKSTLYQDYKYLNSSQLKGKTSLQNLNYNQLYPNFNIKFDFSQKLTFIINQYRVKQQTKVNMNFLGPKQSIEFKSNVEITNPANTWTLFWGIYGFKWGLGFDQVKFVYSLIDNWKVGCMVGQKGSWELMLQNPKLNKSYCTSFALNLGNKNHVLVLKNRFNKKDFGKVNLQLTIQNALKNTQLDKLNFGISTNFNL